MRLFYTIISIFILYMANAQEYNVLFIPDSLLKGTDVVKRKEEYVLEIKSPGKAKIYEHHVYTILNENGQHYKKYKTYYNSFTSINYVTGILYDMMGREIKHLKKKDWDDRSVQDGYSLMQDVRYKVNEFFYNDFPYTVDYEKEDEVDGIRYFDDWFPLSSPSMSVQYSKYIIIAPKNYEVRYKQFNFSTPPVITANDDKKTYTWEIKNVKASHWESNAPSWREIAPNVMFAPSDFSVQGYSGNMSTWENFGKFIFQLLKGRDVLPDDIKKKVHELTDNQKDDKQKIFVLYDFLQKNTRYISIQLGIGGWQPFEASSVASNRYGDCKALSNYMVALLKEAGIKSKYVLIRSGDDAIPLVEEFSCSQFDHAISCVPLGKDTIWLECTNQTVSPGYMGTFTGGRRALIIDEDGGHVVNTPRYSASDNSKIRKIEGLVDEEGTLDANIKTHYSGIQQEFPQWLMYDASKENREKYLNDMFNLPTYQLLSNNYKEEKGIIPVVEEELHVQSKNYASLTGKRLFIAPNIFGRSSEKLMQDTLRKYDYVIRNSYKDIDSSVIKIPNGYKPESLPKDILLDTKFGKFLASVKLQDDKIIYYRMHEQYNGRFPAKEYNDLVKFYEQIYKSDRARVVLVKSE